MNKKKITTATNIEGEEVEKALNGTALRKLIFFVAFLILLKNIKLVYKYNFSINESSKNNSNKKKIDQSINQWTNLDGQLVWLMVPEVVQALVQAEVSELVLQGHTEIHVLLIIMR